MNVKIKPLEWEHGEARTAFGSFYTVHRRADGMYEAVGCGSFIGGPRADRNAAQAAAQADFDRRILDCVTVSPDPRIPAAIEALKEAKNLAALAEDLTGSGSDDEYVWSVQAKIDAALASLDDAP